MKTLFPPLIGLCFVTALSAQPVANSLDELRALGKPVQVQTPALPAPRQTRTIVGEPTSALTRAQALSYAQELAAKIPGAAVAQLGATYDGKLAPAIPTNAILVIEEATYESLRPFDLAIYTSPNKEIRARRILAKGVDRAVVGYEFNDVVSAEVAPEAFVGRIVATILFDPQTPVAR